MVASPDLVFFLETLRLLLEISLAILQLVATGLGIVLLTFQLRRGHDDDQRR